MPILRRAGCRKPLTLTAEKNEHTPEDRGVFDLRQVSVSYSLVLLVIGSRLPLPKRAPHASRADYLPAAIALAQ